jgi:hypothetical protein
VTTKRQFFHTFYPGGEEEEAAARLECCIRQHCGLADEQTEGNNRDPLASRPTVADGVVFTKCFVMLYRALSSIKKKRHVPEK